MNNTISRNDFNYIRDLVQRRSAIVLEADKAYPVSYTHLDVYKRQTQSTLGSANDVHMASSEMARMAAELQQLVDRFRYEPGAFHSGHRPGRGVIRAVT